MHQISFVGGSNSACKGATISNECQYCRKESDDHLPIILTTSGGTHEMRSSVVLLIWKLWPDDKGRPDLITSHEEFCACEEADTQRSNV
jgi:hypothetical protein